MIDNLDCGDRKCMNYAPRNMRTYVQVRSSDFNDFSISTYIFALRFRQEAAQLTNCRDKTK